MREIDKHFILEPISEECCRFRLLNVLIICLHNMDYKLLQIVV